MARVEKLCNSIRVFGKNSDAPSVLRLLFALCLCDKLTTSVNLIPQTFAAVVDWLCFAINKALGLRATLFAGLIFDCVDCLRYF